ncbi:hypothetical protein D3C80_1044620 [compost metagenome]
MQLINRLKRRQQGTGLQRRLASAANQLEYLNDKFDFANAARTEFNVVLQTPTTHFTGDHPFHIAQRLNHAEVDITAEHERAQHGAQLAGVHIAVIAHDARFNHRIAFPVAALLLVIILQRRKAQHQRTAVTKRT